MVRAVDTGIINVSCVRVLSRLEVTLKRLCSSRSPFKSQKKNCAGCERTRTDGSMSLGGTKRVVRRVYRHGPPRFLIRRYWSANLSSLSPFWSDMEASLTNLLESS